MIRTVIGGLVGGIILFVVGFIFWATPLGELAFTSERRRQHAARPARAGAEPDARPAPAPTSSRPTTAPPAPRNYARGPIAIVHFNTTGYSPNDMSMILPGFIFALVSGLLIAFGLAAVGGGGRSFAASATLVVLFSLGDHDLDDPRPARPQPFRLGLLGLCVRRPDDGPDPRRAGDCALVPAAGTHGRRSAAGRGLSGSGP